MANDTNLKVNTEFFSSFRISEKKFRFFATTLRCRPLRTAGSALLKRVVDQQKFQRVFLGTSHLFVGLLRVDHHSIDHLQVAGGLQFWS